MTNLSPIAQKFILHWGEMGVKWGINRTVAQVHALLYISEKPLNAEEICESLDVARSNVSTSLKELQNWGIVRVVHVLGDRRDHFESMTDVYEMFRVILAERKRREIDPTLSILRSCLAESDKTKADATIRDRLTVSSSSWNWALPGTSRWRNCPLRRSSRPSVWGTRFSNS